MKTIISALLLLVVVGLGAKLVLPAPRPVPASPTLESGLAAEVPPTTGVHSVILSYTDSDSGVTFNMYRVAGACPAAAPSPAPGAFVKLNTAAIAGLTYTDSGMTPGTYCYFVTSFLNGAESAPSNLVSAVILPAVPILSGSPTVN